MYTVALSLLLGCTVVLSLLLGCTQLYQVCYRDIHSNIDFRYWDIHICIEFVTEICTVALSLLLKFAHL